MNDQNQGVKAKQLARERTSRQLARPELQREFRYVTVQGGQAQAVLDYLSSCGVRGFVTEDPLPGTIQLSSSADLDVVQTLLAGWEAVRDEGVSNPDAE